ncbi:hydrogen peroxide-dependent heme synthase [Microbacterium sp.]|uniref:hydrogen peroxide-dependent heme synthase n=1 Tax=Microbacterium sp. TaxID=51671 RepID=UPI0039E61490
MTDTIPPVDHSAVADAVNDATAFTMYAVFQGAPTDVAAVRAGLAALDGLRVRGWYDVAGFRADADLMAWWWAEDTATLQAAYRVLTADPGLLPVWSNIGVHRPAEFNRSHVPAFLAGDQPRGFLCVYPFVRGREWYLLPDDERRELLREHGAAARDYRDVLANTVAAFGLGDYEWLLAFEADDLVRIVDLMRELRATGARRHVIEETPFFTGPRVELEALTAR